MANSAPGLDIPGLEIRKLLKLRGISQKALAKEKGLSYTLLNKVLCQYEYETHEGRRHGYKAPHIRKAVAEALGIPYEDLWGAHGKEIVRGLIADEVLKEQTSARVKNEAHARAQKPWSLRLFVKNLIQLGRKAPYLYEKEG